MRRSVANLEVDHVPEAVEVVGRDGLGAGAVPELVDELSELAEALALQQLRLADDGEDGADARRRHPALFQRLVPVLAQAGEALVLHRQHVAEVARHFFHRRILFPN